MGRTVYEYNSYDAWDNGIAPYRHDVHRTFRAEDDAIIDVHRGGKLLGFWDCRTNYGELYTY